MNEVIYFARPFNAFIGSLGTILFFFVLGGIGVLSGLLSRKERIVTRVVMFLTGSFLVVVGGIMSVLVFQEYITGAVTFTARLEGKNRPVSNCGNGGTCTSYILEMRAGGKFYDVDVNQDTYEHAQVRVCYQVTYYPNKGLFDGDNSDSYEVVSEVTRVEVVDSTRCAK